MAIARRPKREENQNVDVDALIAKGGSVGENRTQTTSSENGRESKAGVFTLRVPADLLTSLDTHRKSRPVKVPRQQWILEAIVQRLERESPK